METNESHKDYFSTHAALYAAFRPAYPEELYQFIFGHVTEKAVAWDCATGNGQVARHLSKHFGRVYATDISRNQLSNAYKAKNIFYSVLPAEKTAFGDNQFDLITVAQALHWFDINQFYNEARRVAKSGSIIAVWGYNLVSVSPPVDALIFDFYRNIVGPYWDVARKLVDDSYKHIPFPFDEIETPAFHISSTWTLKELTGYLTTWSATQQYINQHGANPVMALAGKIAPHWQEGVSKHIKFPLFLRMARIVK